MALTAIGAITLTHFDPEFSWSSAPTSRAGRPTRISGMLDWSQAIQLSELFANADRQETRGGVTGVKETFTFNDVLLGPFSGWYFVESYEMSPSQKHSLSNSPVPVSISATFIGTAA